MTATFRFSNSLPDQLPPCNLDAEEAILGGILLDFQAISRIWDTLRPEAFFLDSHKDVYKAALALHQHGHKVDLMTVASWLHDHKLLDKVGGQGKLAQLVENTVSAINIDRYTELVLEKYQRRQMIDLAHELTQLALDSFRDFDTILEQVQEKVHCVIQSPLAQKITPSQHRYNQLIDDVSKVVTQVFDVGYKSFRMHELAKKYSLSPKNLDDIYFKYLVNKDDEPFQNWEEITSKHEDKEQSWLIQGIIPESSTIMLHALGGTGKTRLVYDMVYSLLKGQNWSGFPVTAKERQGLLIQTDESPQHMVRTLKTRGFDGTLKLRYKTKWSVEQVATLRAEVERHRPNFIVIDNLATVSRYSLFSENDVEYARPILLLNEIAREFGCTIIIIHHSSKGGGSRGTTAINNSVDYVLKLEKDPNHPSPDAPERLLTFEKARTRRPAQYQLLFNADNSSWAVVGETGEDPGGLAGKTKDKIVTFLNARRNTVYEAMELHHEIGGSYNNVRRAASQLASDGVIGRKPLSKRGSFGYFIPGEANLSEEDEGLIQLGGNKGANLCENEKLADETASDAGSSEVVANPPPNELPDHADHVADRISDDQISDQQACSAGNSLGESVSQSVITSGAKNSKTETQKSDFWQQTRSANVEPAPSKEKKVITFADHVADHVLDDQQSDQQMRPVHEEEEEIWQVGDRVIIKSVPKGQPTWLKGKVGDIIALSMTGLRLRVGTGTVTLDTEHVQRYFQKEKAETPEQTKVRRYKGNTRPKKGDLVTTGKGKQGIVTAINAGSTAAKYEITWADNQKAGYSFEDLELLEITYERDS
jgi:archaellum biogenesis ATPase FlaH